MLTIDTKALDYAKKNGGNFIVKTISASGGCCDMDIKSISVEFIKDFKENKNYKVYEYNGIKVFIDKWLKLGDNIFIYEKFKIPLIGHIFGSKGISVKYI